MCGRHRPSQQPQQDIKDVPDAVDAGNDPGVLDADVMRDINNLTKSADGTIPPKLICHARQKEKFADDGQPGQMMGEDTQETATNLRRANARRNR